MYHLVFDKEYGFIVIDDTTYDTSAWQQLTIPTRTSVNVYHWDRERNIGKPIEEALLSKAGTMLLASSEKLDFHTRFTPDAFPERLL